MNKMSDIKAIVCFWVWIGILLLSFVLALLAAVTVVPNVVVLFFAVVIFAAALAVVVINLGIFVKRHTTATGR